LEMPGKRLEIVSLGQDRWCRMFGRLELLSLYVLTLVLVLSIIEINIEPVQGREVASKQVVLDLTRVGLGRRRPLAPSASVLTMVPSSRTRDNWGVKAAMTVAMMSVDNEVSILRCETKVTTEEGKFGRQSRRGRRRCGGFGEFGWEGANTALWEGKEGSELASCAATNWLDWWKVDPALSPVVLSSTRF
jgi:hypothetical protein